MRPGHLAEVTGPLDDACHPKWEASIGNATKIVGIQSKNATGIQTTIRHDPAFIKLNA
jgi:hypothetical protein